MKYVKPDLEEIELVLEGSFIANTKSVDVPIKPGEPDEGDDWD